jgi:predicted secreted Zn-dependent protease
MTSALIIVAVFAIALLGMVALVQQDAAVASHDAMLARQEQTATRIALREAELAARTPRPTPTPLPSAPDGMHVVQRGESVFSVAALYGVSANELIYWNKEEYPRLESTPALVAGWALHTSGPPLPTPTPRPTRAPRPTPPPGQVPTPAPIAGMPEVHVYGPGAFPAADRVTVSYYAVTGSTPREIVASKRANGPWSDWLGGAASGMVRTSFSYNFSFRAWSDGTCDVVLTGPAAVTVSYTVILPAWTPPPGTSASTIDWWNERLLGTVVHEGRHIEIYEAFLPAMNQAVASGNCNTVSTALNDVNYQARAQNCEFDMAEYGIASGLSMDACLSR